MEMKELPNSLPTQHELPMNNENIEEPTNVPESETEEGPDFGPPRLHTVIKSPLDAEPQEELAPFPLILNKFPPPPPPPSFEREGRIGIIREIDSDAELLVKPVAAETKTHRMIMVN